MTLFTPSAAPVAAGSPGTDPAATGDGPNVVGLDLSLTGTGVASVDGTRLVRSTGHKGDTLVQRAHRLAGLHAEITSALTGSIDLVAIEAPSTGHARGSSGSVHDRSGLWWLVVTDLVDWGVPVVEVPPATLKKYVTGKGNAQKPDVRMEIFKRYGIDLRDDNEADAFALRALGLDLLGHPLAVMPAANRAALEKLPRPALRGAQ
jgi:Holliday junction resolvasome RuvABC endonuclease subunit